MSDLFVRVHCKESHQSCHVLSFASKSASTSLSCVGHDAFLYLRALSHTVLYRAKVGARQEHTGFEMFWQKLPGQARVKQVLKMPTPEAARKQGQRGWHNMFKRQHVILEPYCLQCAEMHGSNAYYYIQRPGKVSSPLTERH